MTTMPRFRRYRVFLICAVLITVLVVRFKRSDEWNGFLPVSVEVGAKDPSSRGVSGTSTPLAKTQEPAIDIEHLAHANDPPPPLKPVVENVPSSESGDKAATILKGDPARKPKDEQAAVSKEDSTSEFKEGIASGPNGDPSSKPEEEPVELHDPSSIGDLEPANPHDSTKTKPQVIIPDRKPLSQGDLKKGDSSDGSIHPVAPGRVEPILAPSASAIHWEKQKERFPVPPESIMTLPTAKPIAMPKIQFKFPDETPREKIQRELRLSQIKKEFQRAWDGYRTYAWMHDELAPESGKFRDPFCGWAATLVDSLDTLYIMGLEDEFAEAVAAVQYIDFTTCARADLPVFEVTIRYLGGLLGAYDVSGQKDKILLDKAVELGEILIGAFDTPNRMPLLFYQWKPAFASQAHRASTRANLAELGSLTVEFTRLSQLTKEPKFYDAVARITNALEDWQKRGTELPGVFPDGVDASGCNFTLPSTETPTVATSDDNHGHKVAMPANVKEPKPKKKGANGQDDLELQVIPGQPAKGSIRKIEKEEPTIKLTEKASKRDVGDNPAAEGHLPPPEVPPADSDDLSTSATTPKTGTNTTTPSKTVSPVPLVPLKKDEASTDTSTATPVSKTWDCIPKGLDSASPSYNHFSMGGSQDSTYEYFTKEYLLLGGHEDKYRTMYINAMAAVRKHMLYRPMVPGNADILFSGKVTTLGEPDNIMFEPEVTHLTCFLGGMVGMGAKLFDITSDLEIAKKLTDGCVWAYASLTAGVMAEESRIFPCPSVTHCIWNETLWWQQLDPSWATRDAMIEEYDATKAKIDAQRERDMIATEARLAAEEHERHLNATSGNGTVSFKNPKPVDTTDHLYSTGVDVDSTSTQPTELEEVVPKSIGSAAQPGKSPGSVSDLHKRQADQEVPKPVTQDFNDARAKIGEAGKTAEMPKTLEIPKTPETLKNPETPQMPKLPKTKAQLDQELLEKKKLAMEKELSVAAAGRGGQNRLAPKVPQPPGGVAEIDPNRPLNHTAYIKQRIELEGLKPGYLRINSNRYILRPEAIESVWYMYRITGDKEWQEKGWRMFEAVIKATKVKHGHSAIIGVAGGDNEPVDQMESFWLAETLKYFYLLYTTPDIISLDDWVLNTEAHPFRRPT